MKRLVLLVVMILLPASSVSGQPSHSVLTVVQAADVALESGELAAAERLLAPLVVPQRLAQLSPGDRIQVLGRWGDVLLAREDPEGALAAFDKARTAASGEVKTSLTLRLAECFLAVSDPDGARQLLGSLSSTERELPPAMFLRALVLYSVEDREGSGRLFETLLAHEPTAEAAHYLGVLAYERGALEEALKKFSTAIKLDPGDYYSRVYRCRCLLDLHRLSEAERELREVKARRPTPEVNCLLGRALLRGRRDREALSAFRAASRDHPSYAEALFGEASALRRLGEREKAREAAERFRQVHLRQDRDRRRLDALYQRSLRLPGEWQAKREMAELTRSSGDLEAAERHAWRAVRLAPGEVSCRLLLARIFVDQGRYQAAAVQYQRILKLHPDHNVARGELERLVREHARRER